MAVLMLLVVLWCYGCRNTLSVCRALMSAGSRLRPAFSSSSTVRHSASRSAATSNPGDKKSGSFERGAEMAKKKIVRKRHDFYYARSKIRQQKPRGRVAQLGPSRPFLPSIGRTSVCYRVERKMDLVRLRTVNSSATAPTEITHPTKSHSKSTLIENITPKQRAAS